MGAVDVCCNNLRYANGLCFDFVVIFEVYEKFSACFSVLLF
jgi:hypothetical protein